MRRSRDQRMRRVVVQGPQAGLATSAGRETLGARGDSCRVAPRARIVRGLLAIILTGLLLGVGFAAPTAPAATETIGGTQGRWGKLDLRVYTPLPNDAVVTSLDRVVDTRPRDPDREDRLGGYAFTNIDDDDNGRQFDIAETNIAGEDDPIKIELRASCIREPCKPLGVVRLSATSGGEKIAVWESREKQGLVILPAEFSGASGRKLEVIKTLYVEGINPSTNLRDVELLLEPVNFSGKPDTVKVTILRVETVSFFAKDGNVEFEANVFPDAERMGGAARDKVGVSVRLNLAPPLESVDIFLRPFDVDDPSAAGGVLDPNDSLSTGDYRRADGTREYEDSVEEDTYLSETAVTYRLEEDNRGSVLAPQGDDRKEGVLDGAGMDGIATLTYPKGSAEQRTEFRVSMQPGDNYRIMSSHDRDFLPQLRNRDMTDGTLIYDHSILEMVLDHDFRVSTILTVWRTVHLEVDAMDGPDPTEKFDGAGGADDDVGPGQPGEHTIFDGAGAVQEPDFLALSPALTQAFVRVVNDLDAFNTTKRIPFVRNVEEASAAGIGESARDIDSSRAFWVVHILGAYEGPVSRDNDPDSEDALLGIAPNAAEHRGFSLIFQETLRDLHAVHKPPVSVETAESHLVLHEVGHQFELSHNGGGVMSDGIDPTNPAYPNQAVDFSAAQLSAIRAIDAP